MWRKHRKLKGEIMNTNQKLPWYASVVAIIVAFLCFWPIGFVFLYLRYLNIHGKVKTKNAMHKLFSILLIIFGIGYSLFSLMGLVIF